MIQIYERLNSTLHTVYFILMTLLILLFIIIIIVYNYNEWSKIAQINNIKTD